MRYVLANDAPQPFDLHTVFSVFPPLKYKVDVGTATVFATDAMALVAFL